MKNLKLLFALSLGIVLMSFGNKIPEKNIIDNNPIEIIIDAKDVPQNGWGSWKTTSCFRYLKYQIKKASYNGKWYIRFKNNYNKNISMSIKVKGNTGSKTDDGRFTVRSGNEYTQYYFVGENANRISFTIDKVIFGKDRWSGPYANCDH